MFGFTKKMLISLLTRVVNASNQTKCVSLSNRKCMTQPNEYAQALNYYPFALNLDRCVGICNTINNLHNKLCVPKKIADSNIHVFNIRGIMISVGVSVKISNM